MDASLRIFPPVFILKMTRDPLGFLTQLHARHGEHVTLRTGARRFHLVIQPELVRDVLVTQAAGYAKGRGLMVARRVLGNGLLTANGAFHLRQRRLLQPAFAAARMEGYARSMVEVTQREIQNWRDGAVVPLVRELKRITLQVISHTMFGALPDQEALAVEGAVEQAVLRFQVGLIPFLPLMDRLPLPSTRRFQAARKRLDEVIFAMIERRRNRQEDRGDLMSMLLTAREDGTGMDDLQLRDEAMTIFLAGHETTANWLAWTAVLLSQHPEWMQRLAHEVEAVCGGRAPLFSDVAALVQCRNVLQEALRLYPPAWVVGRQAIEPGQLGSQPVRVGDVMLLSQWVAHRQPKWFPEPERFWPERWEQTPEKSLPRGAFFPFAAGNRVCIGEQFARVEATLILATLLQSWSWQATGLAPEPLPRITLGVKGSWSVRLQRR